MRRWSIGVMHWCKHDCQPWTTYDDNDAKAVKAGAALGCVATLLQVRSTCAWFLKYIFKFRIGDPIYVVGASQTRHQYTQITSETACIMLSGCIKYLQCICVLNQQRLAGLVPLAWFEIQCLAMDMAMVGWLRNGQRSDSICRWPCIMGCAAPSGTKPQ